MAGQMYRGQLLLNKPREPDSVLVVRIRNQDAVKLAAGGGMREKSRSSSVSIRRRVQRRFNLTRCRVGVFVHERRSHDPESRVLLMFKCVEDGNYLRRKGAIAPVICNTNRPLDERAIPARLRVGLPLRPRQILPRASHPPAPARAAARRQRSAGAQPR